MTSVAKLAALGAAVLAAGFILGLLGAAFALVLW